ncbi:hypothetical protein VB735_02610 [Halotia wernerae UHCC 0503]|nr:hypothetical protein [Halotia wernerae UHCC 0503]
MSLQGNGAVAIWHDIVPDGLADFYAWHGGEHMPERVAIPGFVRGRRYAALDADLGFFNIYETRDAGVVAGPDYRARLNSPTPWTLKAVQHFRNVARSLCNVAVNRGAADGGLLATLRYNTGPGGEAAHVAALAPLFDKLMATPGIASLAAIVADEAASGEVNAEEKARGTSNARPRVALLVEGWGDIPDFAKTVREILSPATLAKLGAVGAAPAGIYRHQITLSK